MQLYYYFASPWAFVLLLLVPAYLWWYLRRFAPHRLKLKLSYDPQTLYQPKRNVAWLRWLPLVLQLCAIVLLVVALARPQTTRDSRLVTTEGIDIILALDCSKSMETADLKPNRLEAAKLVAEQFVKGRQSDRIGIVIFAQTALSYSPLTLDYALLQQFIREISPNTLPNEGTALGDALGVGVNRLRNSEAPSKVVIALTDGVNTAGTLHPLAAAALAKEFGVRIYTVGIGQDELTVEEGRGGAYIQTENTLDEKALRDIAAQTGGAYYRSTNPENLKKIFDEISRLERTPVKQKVLREAADHYPAFILAAVALLLLAWLLIRLGAYNLLEE
jgi:Ca-activated chloride channel family protein